ncbi:hypothetical protein GEMRC1_005268 [Eukaryota sp. GEM-RC1]
MKTLKTVKLRDDYSSIHDHEFSRICTALTKTIGLKNVDLHYHSRDKDVECTFVLPLLNCPTLKTLKLTSRSTIDSQVFPILVNNKSLEVLELPYIKLKENTFVDICEVLKFNNVLKKLAVPKGKFSFSPVFNSLITNNSLIELEIHDMYQQFSSEETELFLQMLRENTRLRILRLSNHSFDSSFINQIFQSLSVNSTLIQLFLPHLKLPALVACFEGLCSYNITTNIVLSSHSIDISSGCITYTRPVFGGEILSLLNALKSDFPIKCFRFSQWEINSLKILMEAFELFTIYRSVIVADFPLRNKLVNLDDRLFCYNPDNEKHLSADEISDLQTFLEFHEIVELSLEGCRFCEKSLTSLRELITVNTTLNFIDLSHCELSSDDILNVFGDISDSSSLTNINLSENNFSFIGLLRIFEIFAADDSMISTVDVSPYSINLSSGSIQYQKKITDDDLLYLLDLVNSDVPISRISHDGFVNASLHTMLLCIELRHSNSDLIEMYVTPKMLKVGNRSFCFCPQKTYLGPSPSDLFHLQCFLDRFGYKKLMLRGCDFYDSHDTSIRDLITASVTLTSVEISYCQLSCRNITKMFSDFKLSPDSVLTRINLNRNSIGNEGLIALTEALKVNPITEICLQFNSIGNEGVTSLAEALKSGTTVSTIYLRSNSISNEGAIALADALKYNTTVSLLYLQSNLIGNEGAMALADALEVNTTVKEINLRNNPIDLQTQVNTSSSSRDRMRYSFW